MRRAFSVNKGYLDSAPAPTLESIDRNQPWMTTKAGDFEDVNIHELADVPLDDDEDDDYVSDHQSTTCSFSPSDETPTMNNVSYYYNTSDHRSLHFKSTGGTALDIGSDYSATSNISRSFSFASVT